MPFVENITLIHCQVFDNRGKDKSFARDRVKLRIWTRRIEEIDIRANDTDAQVLSDLGHGAAMRKKLHARKGMSEQHRECVCGLSYGLPKSDLIGVVYRLTGQYHTEGQHVVLDRSNPDKHVLRLTLNGSTIEIALAKDANTAATHFGFYDPLDWQTYRREHPVAKPTVEPIPSRRGGRTDEQPGGYQVSRAEIELLLRRQAEDRETIAALTKRCGYVEQLAMETAGANLESKADFMAFAEAMTSEIAALRAEIAEMKAAR